MIYKIKGHERICLVTDSMRASGAPLHEAVKMASYTPARLLGIQGKKGSIGIGKDADLIVFDEDIRVSLVMVRGDVLPL